MAEMIAATMLAASFLFPVFTVMMIAMHVFVVYKITRKQCVNGVVGIAGDTAIQANAGIG